MRKTGAKLLVAQSFLPRSDFAPLKRLGEVYWLEDLDEEEQERVLPQIDCVFSIGWPRSFDAAKLLKMANLRLFQAGNAGVDAVRFDLLGEKVTVCSNAGAYSREVAEFAIGLVLAAAKNIVRLDLELRRGAGPYNQSQRNLDELSGKVASMKGKTLGVIGYGGIGKSTAGLAKSFGMRILGFGRHAIHEKGVKRLQSRKGLNLLLRDSDVILLALPLTKTTRGLIGVKQLALTKEGAILVNVARGELVQQQAVYDWLVKNPTSCYATDVWWAADGGIESFSPSLPFLELENFIGTPHVAGSSALRSGSSARGSISNLMRYFKGQPLRNIVDRSEYD